MQMNIQIGSRAEALDERDRAGVGLGMFQSRPLRGTSAASLSADDPSTSPYAANPLLPMSVGGMWKFALRERAKANA